VRVKVVVWVKVPLLPVTVIVRVPVAALLLKVIFRLELPAPVIDVGLKLKVVPLPCPEADSDMAELKPPVTDEEMVTLPVPEVLATVIDVGAALREKLGVVPVTVSITVVISLVPFAVPVTVIW
jgi:hypothetical protein